MYGVRKHYDNTSRKAASLRCRLCGEDYTMNLFRLRWKLLYEMLAFRSLHRQDFFMYHFWTGKARG